MNIIIIIDYYEETVLRHFVQYAENKQLHSQDINHAYLTSSTPAKFTGSGKKEIDFYVTNRFPNEEVKAVTAQKLIHLFIFSLGKR